MDSLLFDAFEKFLDGHCSTAVIRRIESGQSAEPFWQEVLASGFADAMVPAELGGAGLCLNEIGEIAISCGRHALPVPLAHTIVARALLAQAGVAVPEGSITIASAQAGTNGVGGICALAMPFGAVADWAIIRIAEEHWLVPVSETQRVPAGGHCSLMADVCWSSLPDRSILLPKNEHDLPGDWQVVGAAVTAAQIAGAMARLTDMTIAYANDRTQFGKPIGKLQIIQQQISTMAEQTFAARTAALIGLSGVGLKIHPLRAAVAKARTSEAALAVAAFSHSVHGAIGVTEEFDLQLYTRRLHEWRMQYGSEAYWNSKVGEAALKDSRPPLQFVQDNISHESVALLG